MRAPILIVQHVEAEGPGLLSGSLEAAGFAERRLCIWQGDPVPRRPEGVAALILMGGPMAVYAAASLPHLQDEIALVREALHLGLPILGVCLGSQILAAAAGARVFPGARQEIGWYPIHLTASGRSDPVAASLGEAPTVFHWHSDTFDLPAGAILLASSDLYSHQAFRVGPRAYGLQFHVEVTEEMVGRFAIDGEAELSAAGVAQSRERLVGDARRFAPALARLVPRLVGAFLRTGGLL